MDKPKAKFIVTRYNEPWEWVKEYTDNYLIYNKGSLILNDQKVVNVKNIGGNQHDIFKFIYDEYENLPELMAFIQANPFDHCKKEVFDGLIYSDKFTPLEYYGSIPANDWEGRTEDGGFLEINNSWYIVAHNASNGILCKYSSFDEFMSHYFSNYEHIVWLRFSPGSQYIIEKKQALYYPRDFWKTLMEELPRNNMTEAHIVERALFYILNNQYTMR